MKKYLLSIIFIYTYVFGFAQSSINANNYNTKTGIEIYVGIGASYNNYSNLNNVLKNAALPSIPKFNLNAIIEEDLRFKNLLVGINSYTNTFQKKSGDYNSSIKGICFEINAGYNIINAKKFHLAPQAGIGLLSSGLNITQKTGIDSFNEVLTRKNAIDINQTAGVLDFCLKFDFADYSKRKSEADIIKVGYRYGLSNRGWGIDINNTSTIDDSPKDRLRQVYLMLCLGMSRAKLHA